MMQNVTLTQIKNGPLANALRTISVLISTEDGSKQNIVDTVEDARTYLKKLVDNNHTSSDAAANAERMIINETGMCKDLHDLRNRCHKIKTQPSEYGFELCTCSASDNVPHGRITNKGNVGHIPFFNFEDLYGLCSSWVNKDLMNVNDAITILQESIGIALDAKTNHQNLSETFGVTTLMFLI